MPGRCAEPPAPAMMHASPRSRACSAYSNIASGVRCAETTRCSNGTPKSLSTFAACCMTSQSLWEPITTPTFGFSSIFLSSLVRQLAGVLDVGAIRVEDVLERRLHAHLRLPAQLFHRVPDRGHAV